MLETLILTLALSQATWEELSRRVPADPPPEEITRGLHYVRSDEARHALFEDRIAGKGGVFLGVGTSQNFLMGAWARASHLIIVDFDEIIVHVHDAHRAFFLNAETPEEFLELWRPRAKNRREAFRLIDEAYDSKTRRLDARRALLEFGRRVYIGLKDTITQTREDDTESFLTSQEQYDHLRALYREGKVLTIRGDFTANRTIKGIAEMLETLEMPISILYLSNVEQYIGWNRAFRRNMERFPLSDDALVLRTYGWGRHRTADHNYRYYVQPAAAFKSWIASKKAYVGAFLETETPSDIVGYHEMTTGPGGESFALPDAHAAPNEESAESAVDGKAAR